MKAGRQREFDEQVALDAAIRVFWTNGYNGASLSELTGAMGINKPSLYAAFGNKEALFVSALDRYVDRHGNPHADALRQPGLSLQSRLRAYLESIARMVCDPTLPGGCFVAASTSEAGGECLPASARRAIAEVNRRTRQALVEFFREESAAGRLAVADSAEALADYMVTLQHGLAAMARDGAARERLDGVIRHAVAGF